MTNVAGDVISVRPSSHFAIDMGLGATSRLDDHWRVHGEWTGPMYGVTGFAKVPSLQPAAAKGVLLVVVPPSIQTTAEFSAGISYALASLPQTADPWRRGSWQVGADYGIAAYAPNVSIDPNVIKAGRLGGFVSAPLAKWIDADGGVDVYLRVDRGHSSTEGGRISQAFGGVKMR